MHRVVDVVTGGRSQLLLMVAPAAMAVMMEVGEELNHIQTRNMIDSVLHFPCPNIVSHKLIIMIKPKSSFL